MRGAIASGRGAWLAVMRAISHVSSYARTLLSEITVAIVRGAVVEAAVAIPGGTGPAATITAGKSVLLDAAPRP